MSSEIGPRRKPAGWIAGVLLGVWANGAASASAAEIIDRVMAIVAGQVVTLSDVRGAIELGLVPPPPAGEDPLMSGLLRLVERELVLGEVERYLPPEPDPGAVQQRLDAIRGRSVAPGDFDAIMKGAGMTEPRLRAILRDDIRIESYLEQRFGSVAQPGEEEIIQYYRKHPAEFTRDGAVRPFADVRDAARIRVVSERRRALIVDWIDELRRRGDVTLLYPGSA